MHVLKAGACCVVLSVGAASYPSMPSRLGLTAPEAVLEAAALRMQQLLRGAAAQAVANHLWACAAMRWDPGSEHCHACLQQLLEAAHPHPLASPACRDRLWLYADAL